MHALYAFCRVTDDLADQPSSHPETSLTLAEWRNQLSEALAGHPRHRIHAALADAVNRFTIPSKYLFDIIDGAESDLGIVRFASFAELESYCHQVASAVGLAGRPIWGVNDPEAIAPATAAGVAFQLTNILRDLGEDLTRGRVYLPQDELSRFDCSTDKWQDKAYAERFQNLMRFQVERVRTYYRQADALPPLIPRDGRAVFTLMAGLYERLLDEIERRQFDVFSNRVRVSRFTKARLMLKAWWRK